MAKNLNTYNPAISLAGGITPAGHSDPLVEAHDILVDNNGTRLDEKLENLVLKDNSVTDEKISKKLKVLTMVNLNNLSYSNYIALPVTRSYLEAMTYLEPYYYVTAKDYSNTIAAGPISYIAMYDTDFNLIKYEYCETVNSTSDAPKCAASNNIYNDGVRIYVDFDLGYHVSWDASISNRIEVYNKTYFFSSYYNGNYYGINIDRQGMVSLYLLNNDLSVNKLLFTNNNTSKGVVLQSANIIDGILMIPTTVGKFRFIDIEDGSLILEMDYTSNEEIENIFKDGDGIIKCAGHIYGTNGMFNIGTFYGNANYKLDYNIIDTPGDVRIMGDIGRTGIYKIDTKTGDLPTVNADFINLYYGKFIIGSNNFIYGYDGSNWNIIGMNKRILKSVNYNTKTIYFLLDTDLHFYVYTRSIEFTKSWQTIDVDLNEIYDKLAQINSSFDSGFTFYENGFTNSKWMGETVANSDIYSVIGVVSRNTISFAVRNLSKNTQENIDCKSQFFKVLT